MLLRQANFHAYISGMNLTWHSYSWEDLPKDDLLDCLELRINIFVVEQECPYPEIDGKDKKCWHYYAKDGDAMVCYIRIVPAGLSYDEISIGRVIVADSYRGRELGYLLMKNGIKLIEDKWGRQPIKIGAQLYLKNFYENIGFKQTSEMYLEDDIPHIVMLYTP